MRVVILTLVSVLSLAGCQQAPQQKAQLEPSTANLGLGRVPVGATSNAMAVTFQLDRELTRAASFNYNKTALSGPNKQEFAVTPASATNWRVNRSQTASVAFTCSPKALGARTATFKPTMIGSGSAQIDLRCRGIGKTPNSANAPARISNGSVSSEGPLDFGTLPLGAGAIYREVQVTNTTRQPMNAAISWALGPNKPAGAGGPARGGIFSASPWPNAIPAGSTVIIRIGFDPIAVGDYEAALAIKLTVQGQRKPLSLYTYIQGKAVEG